MKKKMWTFLILNFIIIIMLLCILLPSSSLLLSTMDSWVSLLFFLVLAILYLFRNKYRNNNKLPPGPSGLPIIGHLHMLGDLPHRNLQKLAQKFGSIMYIRLGLVPTIVVSSPEAAELFIKNHDLVFASRPKVHSSEFLSYGQRNLAFAEYGPQWRHLRKICMLELLSDAKIESMKSMRKEDLNCLVKVLKDAAKEGAIVDVRDKVGRLIEDMTYWMIIGRKGYEEMNFRSSIEEIMRLTGAFDLADYIPFVGAFDIQGLHRCMKDVNKLVDGLLENIIDEHVRMQHDQSKYRDFIDVMLSLLESNGQNEEQLDRLSMKAIILDMFVAAIDSSTTAIEWALSELFRHPRVMKCVQSELENVVGMNRMVDESDLLKLEYLDSVIKESMRLHPVGPLLIPHESREDITINGYDIRKKSRLIVNAWAIGHDPQVWSPNVEEFYPERFIGKNMDFQGHDLRFIPFGSGRRGCPGVHLGVTIVRLVTAQLVHCFDWELPNGMSPVDLDMTEKFGLTLPRAKHLLATPRFRLHCN